MGLPNSADVQKSVERLTEYYHLSVPLGDSALSVRDYLGNTAGDNGIPVPSSTLDSARVILASGQDDDGNTAFQVHNETKNNQATFTLDADDYTEETGIGLYFSEDDEVSVEVTSTTSPGNGLGLTLTFEVESAPMN